MVSRNVKTTQVDVNTSQGPLELSGQGISEASLILRNYLLYHFAQTVKLTK